MFIKTIHFAEVRIAKAVSSPCFRKIVTEWKLNAGDRHEASRFRPPTVESRYESLQERALSLIQVHSFSGGKASGFSDQGQQDSGSVYS